MAVKSQFLTSFVANELCCLNEHLKTSEQSTQESVSGTDVASTPHTDRKTEKQRGRRAAKKTSYAEMFSDSGADSMSSDGADGAKRKLKMRQDVGKAKKPRASNLQSKDGARQRLKFLCKQYLTKYRKHPSDCVPEFIAWVRETKFRKADTRCNCKGGPSGNCDCTNCAHCRLERTVELCQRGTMNWPHRN